MEDVRDVRSRLAILGRSAGPVAILHPVGHHAVPLVLGLSVQKGDDTHGHVVTANTTGLAVTGETVVHHVLADGL